MRFSCDECGRSYVAADDVSGRAFRMRCKECGHEIVVRPPLAVHPAPAAQPPLGKPQERLEAKSAARPAFDPFEGQDAAADAPVSMEALEILDRTPPGIRLSSAARPEKPAVTPARPSTSTPPPRPPAPPRVRPGRMLPAEDEAMLGPPGQEGRGGFPRWVIAAVLAGLAAAGGFLLRR